MISTLSGVSGASSATCKMVAILWILEATSVMISELLLPSAKIFAVLLNSGLRLLTSSEATALFN